MLLIHEFLKWVLHVCSKLEKRPGFCCLVLFMQDFFGIVFLYIPSFLVWSSSTSVASPLLNRTYSSDKSAFIIISSLFSLMTEFGVTHSFWQ